MSKIAIKGATTGTGVFTLESPATNTDRTLILPDEAGTVLTSASNVAASQITTALNATGSAPIYACRAWVNFNGTGTVAIRAAGNVSSISDFGTGNYRVNFTTAMPDANYCFVGGMQEQNWGGMVNTYTSYATSYIDIYTFEGVGATRFDPPQVSVAIFR